MKLCPTCQRSYEDDALRFCLEDGTPLVDAEGSAYDPGATIKIPAPRVTSDTPTEVMGEDQLAPTEAAPQAAAPAPAQASPETPARKYEPPSGTAPAARKSSAAPWILGAAVVLGLSAIAVAVIMTRGGADNSQIAQTNQNINASTPAMVEPELIARGDSPAKSETVPASPSQTSSGIGSGSGTGLDNKTPERPTPSPRQTPTAKPTQSPVVADEPPPPPTKPTPSRPSAPVSGGVLNGKAISLPKPAYPPIARAARASGQVTVQVTIDESGNVIAARAVGGHPLLQQSAVSAARQARFSPTKLAGQPVKVTGVITYNFVAQ